LAGSGIICDLTDTIAADIRSLSSCTAPYGNTTTGRFLTASTFITSTATKATTGLKIWSQSLLQIIRGTTHRLTLGSVAMQTSGNCAMPRSLPETGTEARTELRGTLRTESALGKPGSLTARLASIAARLTKLSFRRGQSSAGRIVRLRRCESCEVVYDLTVDLHHCYYANGLLVSNSDAFRYLSVGHKPLDSWSSGPIKRNLKGVF